MQEGGGAQTIGALEIRDGNPVGQAETVEGITGLNVISDPTIRRAAGQGGLGAHGWDIQDRAGNQLWR
jgi:hypothetical protein